MHYYKRNVGDYHKKAGRLTMLEHGSYTLLLDACYDRERFPTMEEAIDWTWARSDEEIAAVRFVLSKFFTLCDGVYTQERIKEEISKYKANAETNSRIATEREAKRRERAGNSTNRARNVDEPPPQEHEAPPNQEPLTNNHKPITNTPHTPHGGGGADLPALAPANEERRAHPRDAGDLPEPHQLAKGTTGNNHPQAGEACAAMKKTGVGLMNPGHPKLNALLHAGVTIDQLVSACASAVGKNKTFAYALSIAEREAEEARSLTERLGEKPATQPSRYSPEAYKNTPPVSTL